MLYRFSILVGSTHSVLNLVGVKFEIYLNEDLREVTFSTFFFFLTLSNIKGMKYSKVKNCTLLLYFNHQIN